MALAPTKYEPVSLYMHPCIQNTHARHNITRPRHARGRLLWVQSRITFPICHCLVSRNIALYQTALYNDSWWCKIHYKTSESFMVRVTVASGHSHRRQVVFWCARQPDQIASAWPRLLNSPSLVAKWLSAGHNKILSPLWLVDSKLDWGTPHLRRIMDKL